MSVAERFYNVLFLCTHNSARSVMAEALMNDLGKGRFRGFSDFVITVCDNAAGEVCPGWPGQPITAHWGAEDPSLFLGSDDDKRRKFAHVAGILKRRIELLASLPLATLQRLALEKNVRDIGRA